MTTTSVSLLDRLRQSSSADDWRRFVELYTPLMYRWAKGAGLPAEEAADLVQEVLLVVIQKMPEFVYNPSGSFRGWLRTVTMNKCRDLFRKSAHAAMFPLQETDAGSLHTADNVGLFAEEDYRRQLAARALELVQAEFSETTVAAFMQYVVAARPPAEVAEELNISVNSVYLAKARVLSRLRTELEGLWE